MIERKEEYNEQIMKLIDNIERVIVGKRQCIELVVAALLAEGHVLIEDVPGVGKTQLAASLAASLEGIFGRIQMTPDIMPSDIVGFNMIDGTTGENRFKQGAAFCNFLLADEINRSSPKSQSALLEVMEEKQVSMDGSIHILPKPFMVLATQNPIETFGTYHLPEAQMDRFLIKISLGYPGKREEMDILLRNEKKLQADKLKPVMNCEEVIELTEMVKKVYCSEPIQEYIVNIAESTRNTEWIKLGISPRGCIAMYKMAKALAFIRGRDYVIPDDIKELVPYVFSHRIILTPKGKSVAGSNEAVLRQVLEKVEVPIG